MFRGAALPRLKEKCTGSKYVLTGELSLIGCHSDCAIDSRLHQSFLLKAKSCSIIMFGDFDQPSPVGDASMFKPKQKIPTLCKDILPTGSLLVCLG